MSDNLSVTAGTGSTIGMDEVIDGTLGTVKVGFGKIMDGTLDSTNKLIVNSSGEALTKDTTARTSLASLDGKVPSQGQALAAGSTPVVLPVAQITTLTPPAAITGYATSTKQSDGSQKTQLVDGSGNVVGATTNALDINIKSGNPTSITANAGTNLNTSALALESGGNLATIAGSITGAKAQVNISQINGATPLMGAGNTGAGSPRVTIASDQAVIPISDNSGSLTVDAPVGTPVFATITPSATGGWSPYSNTGLTNSVVTPKSSAGTMGGYVFFNPNTTVAYVQFFDAASPTLGSTSPTYVIGLPPQSTANVEFANGINHATAIKCAATTTATGSSALTTALVATILFK